MTGVLQAHQLAHRYGDMVALHPLELTLDAGETVALIGPNGAGKTTFLLVATGLLEPSAGGVSVCGHPAGSIEARAALSFIPDTPALYDDLSLAEHLEYVARLHGEAAWEDLGFELLERLGLSHAADLLPRGFSRGMRQKAAIAIAFVRPFQILLADEPFDGLDPWSRKALDALLEGAAERGAAVIVSTHRSEVVARASRCVALHDGRLVYDGLPGAAPFDW